MTFCRRGGLQRVHGGALPASPTIANLAARRSMATEEKQRLGRKAATLISRNQRVFIDGGTDQIQRLNIDLAFIGLTGLHPEEGGTTGDYEEAAIKAAVIARSAETVALMTVEKLGAVSAYAVCALTDLASVIVPREADVKGFAKTSDALIRA